MTLVHEVACSEGDLDPNETSEWLEALDQVVADVGSERAQFLITRLIARARQRHVDLPIVGTTDYVNNVRADADPEYPGGEEIERRIRRIVRWNAAAMVTRANLRHPGLGAHISTYSSAATLYHLSSHHLSPPP